MLPSMKFYVVSIVSIFIALGLGIYIGFSMDTEDFITERQESLIEIVESNFETITEENKELVLLNEKLESIDKNKNTYIKESYEYIVPDRLQGLKVSIIESNPDYVISGIGRDLELAGAEVLNVTTLNKKLLNNDGYKEILSNIITGIIKGEGMEKIKELGDKGYIDSLGSYSNPADILIVSGGSENGNNFKFSIEKDIINLCKENNTSLLGVEKSSVKNSSIGKYKESNISTIDNVDKTMGKVAMILSLEGRKGHFGEKGTAENILPIK